MNFDSQEIKRQIIEVLQKVSRSEKNKADRNLSIAVDICHGSNFLFREFYPSSVSEEIIRIWNEVIPDDVRTHCQPSGLNSQGTLFATVDSYEWLREIVQFRRTKIINQIQERIDTVKKIAFREGEIHARTEISCHVSSVLWPALQHQSHPSIFGNPQRCIETAIALIMDKGRFSLSFVESDSKALSARREKPTIQSEGAPTSMDYLTEAEAEIERLLMAQQNFGDPNKPFSSILSTVAALRTVASRKWAAYKRAEELDERIRATELKIVATYWYNMANLFEGALPPLSDENRMMITGLAKLSCGNVGLDPQVRFQAALFDLDQTRVAVVVVKQTVLDSDSMAKHFRDRFTEIFPDRHVFLAAQDASGVNYYGHADLLKRLVTVSVFDLPWREYVFTDKPIEP